MKDASDETPALLMVDDHPANLLAPQAVLDPLGYRIAQAASGVEALRRAGEQDFVLILMDVQMPDRAGGRPARGGEAGAHPKEQNGRHPHL